MKYSEDRMKSDLIVLFLAVFFLVSKAPHQV